jgi:hypothetical protein
MRVEKILQSLRASSWKASNESIKMAFGDENTSIVFDILKIPKQEYKASIDLEMFVEKLDAIFGENAEQLRSMI